MKVRLTKPFRQAGRVIPAGVILSDAPVTLMRKLVSDGHAEWVRANGAETASTAPESAERGKPVPSVTPPSTGVAPAPKRPPGRKGAKRDG